jgi:hypothetical protein
VAEVLGAGQREPLGQGVQTAAELDPPQQRLELGVDARRGAGARVIGSPPMRGRGFGRGGWGWRPQPAGGLAEQLDDPSELVVAAVVAVGEVGQLVEGLVAGVQQPILDQSERAGQVVGESSARSSARSSASGPPGGRCSSRSLLPCLELARVAGEPGRARRSPSRRGWVG